MALTDVANDLDVPERFLADLENSRLEAFGPPLHAAAYLQVYARYLGLDEGRVLGGVVHEPDETVGASRRRWLSRRPPRRVVLLAAVSLVVIGALAAIVAALMLDPDGEMLTLDVLVRSEAVHFG